MTRRNYLFIYYILLASVVVLQTTVLLPLHVRNARPDFTLLLLVFFAHQLGSFQGKFMGFTAGLLMDIIGMAPLGFHSFIYTVAGHFFGATKGKVFIDILTLPILMALLASILKLFISFLLTIFFEPNRLAALFTVSTLIELGLNAVISPFLYAILRLLRLSREHETQML